jgi:hypothetical protein
VWEKVFRGARIGYPAEMKFQFSILAMMIATAFVAITFGAWMAVWRVVIGSDPSQRVIELAGAVVVVSPFWVPFLFVAYALGRRQLHVRLVALFAIVEIAACFATTILIMP